MAEPGTEPGGVVRASTVVNGAGAWAEHVGSLLGAAPQGLQPLRRTAALVRLTEPMPPEHPIVMDAAEHWYFRPDPVGAMVSMGESELSEACDAQPHPGAVERLGETIQSCTGLRITEVAKAWTGLRTERASDVPVCGWNAGAEGVFWLAGQGGYGFQTSAAMATAAAEQIVAGSVGEWLSPDTVAALQPERGARPPPPPPRRAGAPAAAGPFAAVRSDSPHVGGPPAPCGLPGGGPGPVVPGGTAPGSRPGGSRP
ncbi:FAD-dependent oxidoreductase [Kocuria tytonicola]|uniref:FAD-dependent oxidoreductase n=1 Tax=Kocuria tytonicola TaxID=2055946 RepID=UPI001F0C4AFC|nr:FAD-dependent oxidoreductase [Kocuria tytonicola]